MFNLCASGAGQWSPRPLDAEHVAGQEVITEEEDILLLELLRAQIKYRAARQYAQAARQAAGNTDGAAFQDRAYQVINPPPAACFVAQRSQGSLVSQNCTHTAVDALYACISTRGGSDGVIRCLHFRAVLAAGSYCISSDNVLALSVHHASCACPTTSVLVLILATAAATSGPSKLT